MHLCLSLTLLSTIGSAALTRRTASPGLVEEKGSLVLVTRGIKLPQTSFHRRAPVDVPHALELQKRGNCSGKPCAGGSANRPSGSQSSRTSNASGRPNPQTFTGQQSSAQSLSSRSRSTSPAPRVGSLANSRPISRPRSASPSERSQRLPSPGPSNPAGRTTSADDGRTENPPRQRDITRLSPTSAATRMEGLAESARQEYPPIHKPDPGRPLVRSDLDFGARRRLTSNSIPPVRPGERVLQDSAITQTQGQLQSLEGPRLASGASTVNPIGPSRDRSLPSTPGMLTPERSPPNSKSTVDRPPKEG